MRLKSKSTWRCTSWASCSSWALRAALLGLLPVDGLDVLGKLLHDVLDAAVQNGCGHRVELGADLLRRLLPLRELRIVLGALGRRGEGLVLGPPGRVEEGLQGEIVLLQDGVELVVVALGAAHPESEEGLARDVGHLGEDEIPLHPGVALVPLVDAEAQEGGGDEGVGIVRGELVGGELLADELVVGFVLVERADHVVAIHPGLGTEVVGAVAVALGVADHVEPVLAPAFAVARAGEEFVGELGGGLVRIGGEGLLEGDDLLRRGRQAVQVEIEAAYQFPRVGGAGGLQVLLRELRGDEGVDGILRPAFPGLGRRGIGHGLDRPPVLVLRGEAVFIGLTGLRDLGRPGRAKGDPLLEGGDLLARQGLFRRHREVGIAASGERSGFLSTMAGPLSPPFTMKSRWSRRRPPFVSSALWHL